MRRYALPLALAAAPLAAQPSQPAPNAVPTAPEARLAAQREAMRALSFMDGEWRGPAEVGGGHRIVQTERIGPLLDGAVKVIEGRGHEADGTTSFNALGIISYDLEQRRYIMRSYAMGYVGDFPLEMRPNGFRWQIPAGPGAVIRYTATVDATTWHEVGERIAGDAPPVRVFEMRLTRLGPSRWPADGAVSPQ